MLVFNKVEVPSEAYVKILKGLRFAKIQKPIQNAGFLICGLPFVKDAHGKYAW